MPPSLRGRPASAATVRRLAGTLLVVSVGLAALLPGTVFALVTVRQDQLLDTVFAGSGDVQVAQPSPLGDLGITTTAVPASPTSAPPVTLPTTTSPATTTVPTTVATTVPAPPPLEPGRWNIALLGGDAGPQRWGLRTDTMIVVSIDRQTGDLASVSVPRNLQRLPMPPGPLRDRFPNGFDDLANALFPYVFTHPDLGLDPAQAIKGGLAELLGIPIDNYVLVDMEGFMHIIDALGGVTVDLSTNVPLVPNIDGRTKEAPSVGPGPVTMNGAMALSFVRTREADSDYSRMKRQRCLLAAVAAKTSPADLALNYLSLASAVEGSFRSDIPREQAGRPGAGVRHRQRRPGPHAGAGPTRHQALASRRRPDPRAGGRDVERRRAAHRPCHLGPQLLSLSRRLRHHPSGRRLAPRPRTKRSRAGRRARPGRPSGSATPRTSAGSSVSMSWKQRSSPSSSTTQLSR